MQYLISSLAVSNCATIEMRQFIYDRYFIVRLFICHLKTTMFNNDVSKMVQVLTVILA